MTLSSDQFHKDGPACISVFDNLAELLDEELVMSGVEPKVSVATNINPKLVGGDHFHVTHLLVRFLTDNYFHFCWCLIQRYCNDESKMIVVYEYMKKGTLKDHLYDSDNPRLSWRQKLEICAKGLHYLHTGSQEPLYTACEVCFRYVLGAVLETFFKAFDGK
ncbi:unnamed protein product [Brassica napus]|nr:unnamed protein product [Brassica napus]